MSELVPLTPKAFGTPLVLVARSGQVVGKAEVIEALWPDSSLRRAA